MNLLNRKKSGSSSKPDSKPLMQSMSSRPSNEKSQPPKKKKPSPIEFLKTSLLEPINETKDATKESVQKSERAIELMIELHELMGSPAGEVPEIDPMQRVLEDLAHGQANLQERVDHIDDKLGELLEIFKDAADR